ncbi:Las1-domain-containing protein [Westerdykella ornata]|uniref:Las1-domain-containing protein n=1 Tax=Westerdykella ornata TaxID=318751 RepID=A0A6A6JB00_WESOR|nr:Las1-domain-containing protein [Westerdykella ornata]KAF2273158.1 Las1-domain-containing protein [Westerdykella ornata]
MERPNFVATPWRNGCELLELRTWFFGAREQGSGQGKVDRRREGVDRVLAWRARKPELPLLLDSTADLVDAVLQDEAGLEASALRLVYAAAVARFITGLTDTTLDLRRSRPHWHIPTSSASQPVHNTSDAPFTSTRPNAISSSSTTTTTTFLDLPAHLLETRHNIVHRHLPPLSVLKKAARDSLKWLWDAYWSHLDIGLAGPTPDASPRDSLEGTSSALREKLHGVLKTYLRARKAELLSSSSSSSAASKKTRSKSQSATDKSTTTSSAAAETALFTLSTLPATPLSSPPVRDTLLELLVLGPEPMILPTARRQGRTSKEDHDDSASKKTNNNMAGAFLLWSPLLLLLSSPPSSASFSSSTSQGSPSPPSFLPAFVEALLTALDGPTGTRESATQNGLQAWLLHVLTSEAFSSVRKSSKGSRDLVRETLEACFTTPSAARLSVAEALLGSEGSGIARGERQMWGAVLEAARRGTGREEQEQQEGEGKPGEGQKEQRDEEDAMQIDMHETELAPEAKAVKKLSGPQKYVGLWRPRPIGWVGGD